MNNVNNGTSSEAKPTGDAEVEVPIVAASSKQLAPHPATAIQIQSLNLQLEELKPKLKNTLASIVSELNSNQNEVLNNNEFWNSIEQISSEQGYSKLKNLRSFFITAYSMLETEHETDLLPTALNQLTQQSHDWIKYLKAIKLKTNIKEKQIKQEALERNSKAIKSGEKKATELVPEEELTQPPLSQEFKGVSSGQAITDVRASFTPEELTTIGKVEALNQNSSAKGLFFITEFGAINGIQGERKSIKAPYKKSESFIDDILNGKAVSIGQGFHQMKIKSWQEPSYFQQFLVEIPINKLEEGSSLMIPTPLDYFPISLDFDSGHNLDNLKIKVDAFGFYHLENLPKTMEGTNIRYVIQLAMGRREILEKDLKTIINSNINSNNPNEKIIQSPELIKLLKKLDVQTQHIVLKEYFYNKSATYFANPYLTQCLLACPDFAKAFIDLGCLGVCDNFQYVQERILNELDQTCYSAGGLSLAKNKEGNYYGFKANQTHVKTLALDKAQQTLIELESTKYTKYKLSDRSAESKADEFESELLALAKAYQDGLIDYSSLKQGLIHFQEERKPELLKNFKKMCGQFNGGNIASTVIALTELKQDLDEAIDSKDEEKITTALKDITPIILDSEGIDLNHPFWLDLKYPLLEISLNELRHELNPQNLSARFVEYHKKDPSFKVPSFLQEYCKPDPDLKFTAEPNYWKSVSANLQPAPGPNTDRYKNFELDPLNITDQELDQLSSALSKMDKHSAQSTLSNLLAKLYRSYALVKHLRTPKEEELFKLNRHRLINRALLDCDIEVEITEIKDQLKRSLKYEVSQDSSKRSYGLVNSIPILDGDEDFLDLVEKALAKGTYLLPYLIEQEDTLNCDSNPLSTMIHGKITEPDLVYLNLLQHLIKTKDLQRQDLAQYTQQPDNLILCGLELDLLIKNMPYSVLKELIQYRKEHVNDDIQAVLELFIEDFEDGDKSPEIKELYKQFPELKKKIFKEIICSSNGSAYSFIPALVTRFFGKAQNYLQSFYLKTPEINEPYMQELINPELFTYSKHLSRLDYGHDFQRPTFPLMDRTIGHNTSFNPPTTGKNLAALSILKHFVTSFKEYPELNRRASLAFFHTQDLIKNLDKIQNKLKTAPIYSTSPSNQAAVNHAQSQRIMKPDRSSMELQEISPGQAFDLKSAVFRLHGNHPVIYQRSSMGSESKPKDIHYILDLNFIIHKKSIADNQDLQSCIKELYDALQHSGQNKINFTVTWFGEEIFRFNDKELKETFLHPKEILDSKNGLKNQLEIFIMSLNQYSFTLAQQDLEQDDSTKIPAFCKKSFDLWKKKNQHDLQVKAQDFRIISNNPNYARSLHKQLTNLAGKNAGQNTVTWLRS